MSKKTIKILKELEKDEVQDLIKTCALIADPLSQELMRKAAES